MSGGEKDRYIFVEQITQLVKKIRSMTLLNLLVATIISLLLLGNVPTWIPALWFTGALLLWGGREWYYHNLKNKIITVDNVNRHGAIVVGFSFASGAIWGLLGLILPIETGSYVMVLTVILLSGMVAGSASFLSVYKKAYFAFAVPCIAPFAIRCILSQQEILVTTGTMLSVYLVIHLFISHLIQKNILKGINLVLENKDLIEKLKHEKSNADEARTIADHNNEAKSRFLAIASHDLRQPLHAMGFFVEALLHEKDPVKINTLVKKVAQTSEALRNLIGSLLDISKIEAGCMEPHRSHFILNELLAEISQEFTEQAQEKGLDIDYKPSAHIVYSDKEMLGRVLRNLVSNAVRYTARGYVNISCESEAGHVVIRVSDSGRGIPESYRRDIFREFFQIEGEEYEKSQGLGLGLSIVDGLCRLLDHDITLYSETGVGSVFSVKIPQGNLNKVDMDDSEFELRPGEVIARAIILNNEDASRESISGIMRHWGYMVADFNTCAEVMEFLESEDFTPDLVISDIKLQDASGIEAIDAIQRKITRKIPGIIMTGVGSGAIIDKVLSNGLFVLQKPVQPAKLRSTVSYLIQGEE